MWGRRGITQRGRGVFSRAHAKAIISRTGRSCLRYYRFRRVYSMYIYRGSQGIRTRARTYTHVYIQYRPVANNYSGQLDIPRAYKRAHAHERADSIPTYLSVLFRRCSADLIFDYATMRSLDRQSRGKSGARFWNTHDASTSSKGSAHHG